MNNIKAEELKQIFKSILIRYSLNENDIQLILNKIKQVKISKNTYFCEAGMKQSKLGILIKGSLIAYYNNSDGKNIISRFYQMPELIQNIIVCDFESFKNENKSQVSIKALEDSFMFVIQKTDLEYLYNVIPQLNKMGRELAEDSYIHALNRIHEMQNLSAEERVRKFTKDYGCIIKTGQINHIASYLGMTRRRYTEMKNKILR